jgi:hypothetical protein
MFLSTNLPSTIIRGRWLETDDNPDRDEDVLTRVECRCGGENRAGQRGLLSVACLPPARPRDNGVNEQKKGNEKSA